MMWLVNHSTVILVDNFNVTDRNEMENCIHPDTNSFGINFARTSTDKHFTFNTEKYQVKYVKVAYKVVILWDVSVQYSSMQTTGISELRT